MFARQDRRARRRAASPTLATLEDRRLMTAGVASAAVAVAGDVGTAASPTRDSHDDAATAKDWIVMGSDAQFGPAARVLLSDGRDRSDPSPPSGTTTDPSTPRGALDAALLKQSTDFQAARDGSEVTPQLLDALRSARDKAASEAKTPDPAAVQTLQNDVETVWRSGTFTDVQRDLLKADLAAALKSAGVSDATLAGLVAAQDAVTAAGHVSIDDLQTLAADQAAVQTRIDALAGDAAAYDAVPVSGRDARGPDAFANSPRTRGSGPPSRFVRPSRGTNPNRHLPNPGAGSSAFPRKPPSFHGMRTARPGPRA